MTKDRARWVFLTCLAKLIDFAERQEIPVLVYDFDRSESEQLVMRAKGLSRITRSAHEDWLAVDVVRLGAGGLIWIFDRNDRHDPYALLGRFWELVHPLCEWGGRWETPLDPYHFGFNQKWRVYA